MNKKKCAKLLIVVLCLLIVNGFTMVGINVNFNKNSKIILSYNVVSDRTDVQQVYYSTANQFGEDQAIKQEYQSIGEIQNMQYVIPKEMSFIRIDMGMTKGKVILSDVKIKYGKTEKYITDLISTTQYNKNDIDKIEIDSNKITINSVGNDPFIILDISSVLNIGEVDKKFTNIIKVILCGIIDVAIIFLLKARKKLCVLAKETFRNKELIWNLSRNDFKTKYAASYFGVFWAFVQPVVTTLIYWFVFEVGFKAAPASDAPFVLWLVAGIVPWFFFAEALMNATNSLLEYSYLVKKVVFKISILPIVKIVSSLFVHIFFVGIAFLVFILYGKIPTIYSFQIIYYIFCTFVLVLAISYFTSSVVIFFRDLGQIVNVILQIGMWLTPIMWNQNMIGKNYQWVLKLNPIYYIVEGYRDCFISKVWFWDKPLLTIYFWMITIICFGIGAIIFKRLKKHFADVL